MITLINIWIHVLTYDPGGSSDGSQSHQHHTHSKHAAGGQHTGQRDSSVPYRQFVVYRIHANQIQLFSSEMQNTGVCTLKSNID